MVDKDSQIIAHRGFDKVVDSTTVDIEEIPPSPITSLAEAVNLTPFKKMGSIKQVAGSSSVISNASFPDSTKYSLTNFEPVDYYIFGLDKDSKEIYVLVYKHTSTGEIRIFITPWWNPGGQYDNSAIYDEVNVPYSSWISTGTYRWLELTEKYSGQISNVATNAFEISANLNSIADIDNYFKGFFVVNTYESGGVTRQARYNYITAHNWTEGSPDIHAFTVKGDITGLTTGSWVNGDTVTIVRFPVTQLYTMNANTLAHEGEVFTGRPTQFKYRENELRMPCGKEKRPLMLSFISERKYMLGNENDMGHDGFWFDFQQPPQKLNNSAVTAFSSRMATYSGTSKDIQCVDSTISWVTAGNGKVTLTPYGGSYNVRIRVLNLVEWNYYKIVGKEVIVNKLIFHGVNIYFKSGQTVTKDEFQLVFNNKDLNSMYPNIVCSAKTGNISTPTYNGSPLTNHFVGSSGLGGDEAGDNIVAYNPFVGAAIVVHNSVVSTNVQRNAFIYNLIYDNRSQNLLAHGTFDTSEGFEVRFTLWFSRRLTGVSLFTEKIEMTGTGDSLIPYVYTKGEYPYFSWVRKMGADSKNINEIRHHSQCSIFDFAKSANGELPRNIINVIDKTLGYNNYVFSSKMTTQLPNSAGYFIMSGWFLVYKATTVNFASSETGIRYVSKCNRYIDQDTTMNYTRCEFVGQTNGRFFLIGIKNTVGQQTFESNDIISYNIYAGAVSEYDTYLSDRFMPVVFGDNDQLRAIENFNGYLLLVKDRNSYSLDVNTSDEVKYRTVDTRLGRGCSYPDMMCQTPTGMIMPSSDGVWLVSPNGSERILREDNGKLDLYKSLLTDSQTTHRQTLYYSERNELFLTFRQDLDSLAVVTYVFFYSFERGTWGGYYLFGPTADATHSESKPLLFRVNTLGEITYLNWSNLSNCNIAKINNSSSTFLACDGTEQTISFKLLTHYLAYAGRVRDIRIQKLTLNFDAIATASRSLNVRFLRKGKTSEAHTLVCVGAGGETLTDQMKDVIAGAGGIGSLVAVQIDNGTSNKYTDFTINSFYLWMATQQRNKV